MNSSVEDEVFADLRKIDTPTITNVVATYPNNHLCLGLYKSVDGKLVYGYVHPMHLSGPWCHDRPRRYLRLRAA